jgi:cytochrome c5
MGQRSNKRISGALIFWGWACISILLLSNAWSQTFISGKVITADGKVVASGAVALEKGELHNDAFLAGGAIASDGSFKIPLPSPGPWGLHVYSEGYIYFPLQDQIKADTDNEIPVILPVDGKNSDDPRISDFRFEGEEGRAELELLCRQNQIRLQGSSRLPDRSGDWFFDKLQNARAAGNGKDLFAANCSGCHFPDRKDAKVGPGLLGLFKNPKLPKSGRATSEENVRETIVNGFGKMPPFRHLKEPEINALVDYLKSL